MNASMKTRKLRRLSVFLTLLALAIGVRSIDLGTAPPPMATADEFHYTWCGLSLLAQGKPTAWSWLSGYEKTPAFLGDVQSTVSIFKMVSPALDHPPLYSLLAGSFTKMIGARSTEKLTTKGKPVLVWDFDLGRARILSVILFAVSFVLLYDITARRCGWWVAVMTLLIYGMLSHIVLHSKLLVTETLTTPLLLGGIAAWDRYRLGRWSELRFAIVTILLIAAAEMSKLVAVSQAAVILFLLVMAGRRREMLYPILGVAVGTALFCAYGYWQGWEMFMKVLSSQSARFHGFATLNEIFLKPLLVHQTTISYPILLGWGALFSVAVGWRGTRGRALVTSAVVYFLGFCFFVSAPAVFGWHIMPYYPFMCMAIAIVFCEAYRRPNQMQSVAMMALMLPMALESIYLEHMHWGASMRYFYFALAAMIIGTPLLPAKVRVGAPRWFLIATLAALLIHEFWIVWFEAM